MAFDEKLGERIKQALSGIEHVEEKKMFGGLCFMINDKMCVGVIKDDMICRIGEDNYKAALKRPGCREMVFSNRPSKGFVFVSEEGMSSKKDFDYWLNMCLKYNPLAKSSKKKAKTKPDHH